MLWPAPCYHDGNGASRTQPNSQETSLILLNHPTLEGKTIREYRGIVVGEAILGANIFC